MSGAQFIDNDRDDDDDDFGWDDAEDEWELLNIAVAQEFRRKGLARALWSAAVTSFRGTIFLEVRASNQAAINLYKSLNFKGISTRKNYYEFPSEAAIVMRFLS